MPYSARYTAHFYIVSKFFSKLHEGSTCLRSAANSLSILSTRESHRLFPYPHAPNSTLPCKYRPRLITRSKAMDAVWRYLRSLDPHEESHHGCIHVIRGNTSPAIVHCLVRESLVDFCRCSFDLASEGFRRVWLLSHVPIGHAKRF